MLCKFFLFGEDRRQLGIIFFFYKYIPSVCCFYFYFVRIWKGIVFVYFFHMTKELLVLAHWQPATISAHCLFVFDSSPDSFPITQPTIQLLTQHSITHLLTQHSPHYSTTGPKTQLLTHHPIIHLIV